MDGRNLSNKSFQVFCQIAITIHLYHTWRLDILHGSNKQITSLAVVDTTSENNSYRFARLQLVYASCDVIRNLFVNNTRGKDAMRNLG